VFGLFMSHSCVSQITPLLSTQQLASYELELFGASTVDIFDRSSRSRKLKETRSEGKQEALVELKKARKTKKKPIKSNSSIKHLGFC